MNTPSTRHKDFSLMSKIEKYQYFLRRKYQHVENTYYPLMDDFEQKLADLRIIDPKEIPDFTIHQFSFIRDWQAGECDTSFVLELLSSMNFPDIAEKQITRRLSNFVAHRSHPVLRDYVNGVRDQLIKSTVPLYNEYLNLLLRYFKKLQEIDESQVKLTWLEQIHRDNGEVVVSATDISLNQAFRHLDTSVIPFSDHKYVVGNNLIVFNEEMDSDMACHWIFGPQSYIKELSKMFNVVETMDIAEEKDYIKRLIGVYVT